MLLVLMLACLPAQAVTLHGLVRHQVEGRAVELDAPLHKTRSGEVFSITRASYLLGGFALRRDDGIWLDTADHVAWMDAARNRAQFTLGGVPAGRYTALRFHVGLDAASNAADPARHPHDHPLNPNVCGLHWSWQGGYIFLALEGGWRAGDGTTSGFSYHLARDANRTAILLEGDFDLTGDAAVEIAFDLAKVLNGARPLSFAKDGVSTHSQPGDPVAAALVANLPGAFALKSVRSRAPESARIPGVKAPGLPEKFTPFQLKTGAGFPVPALPPDNPLIEERVALGERLFNDTALSRDGRLSCAGCHPRERAFADPRRVSIGVDGRAGTRQGMPLFNLAWKTSFFWDGRARSLREQALIPIQDHLEMDETLENVVMKLGRSSSGDFARAFDTPEVTPERIGLALESYLLTLTSHDSKFDRAMRGEEELSAEERRGFELFMQEREPRMGSMGADCFHCHGGALFTDHQFRNNGLAIDEADLGRFRVTKAAIDRGTFSTPSLRNIAVTAPYMHDGRFTTLEQVLDHYSEGVQRTDTLDPNLAKHPDGGLRLTAEEKRAVIAFLKTLTDRAYLAPQ